MLAKILACAMLTAMASTAMAQDWPSQPIKYIVPFPPGGATDIISRPLADKLRERLGQAVVIENIGGAGASIGVGRLKQAKADGYTIGLGNSASQTITPHLLAKVPYDPLSDFTPISMLTEYANVLVVSAQSPVRDMKEFLALAKSKPNGLSYGSAGTGSSNHLSSALLGQATGLPFTHVPYKGSSAAMTDLMGGQVDWMFATISEIKPFVQAGKMRALGISSKTRDALLPDVPPIADTVPGYEVVGFMGLFAPAKLPPAITARLTSEVNAILKSPDMIERFAAQGMRARTSTPDELAARVRRDHAMWKAVVTAAGIKAE
ncbi:MAG: tripartite tricarboxylate transporter substrate binding protein [Polaromonas sp.]|uniref:Bug family tripartite tricarboxylate transporter substrate binding protein n=1 Tax=Polaromonas sp. TaxID=1869339 RepID=UPI0025F42AB4|nr:tripartite tricarboxylate transporter substrate binding protein [Polaromonas sp.]MBI2726889.1 tripartite tricarboxylate transporter substrate binding protein [Polaromonas sp.]